VAGRVLDIGKFMMEYANFGREMARPSVQRGFNGAPSAVMERRRWPRASVHWPLLLFRGSSDEDAVETVTHNLSSRGLYCFSPKAFEVGEMLFGRLKMPLEINGVENRMECRLLVVRVEGPLEHGFYGLACRTQDYRVGGILNPKR
jgi:hypothetical protein